jgi:hypothetical protein
MDTASRAADAASLQIHYALENNDKAGLNKTLEEVQNYQAQHHRSDKEFNSRLNKDLHDVLPQMSLMWAQDHQNDLAAYSSDSGNITRQGIADYEMSSAPNGSHSVVDNMMADSLRQNWDRYSNSSDGPAREVWDFLDHNQHFNSADIDSALAPMQSGDQAKMAVSQLANNPEGNDSLFRKLSESGEGMQITPDSLHHALSNDDARFMNDRQRASAQYLADHYTDIDKFNGGSTWWNPGIYPDTLSGQWQGSWYEHFPAPITPDAISQYSSSTLDQPAQQIVQNTEKAEQVTAGKARRQRDDSDYPDGETGRADDATGRPDNYKYDDAPPAVPEQMYADARVQAGEGFYQAAQRMLGPDAPADQTLSLAHNFKAEYARDNNDADPSGLPVGYNFLTGYNKDDWNSLVAQYPRMQQRTQTGDSDCGGADDQS